MSKAMSNSPSKHRRQATMVLLSSIALVIPTVKFARADEDPVPTTQQIAINRDSTLDEILTALWQRGETLSSLSADVELREVDETLGKDVYRLGTLALDRNDGETRILVNFTESGNDLRSKPEHNQFLLAGETLIERNYETRKQIIRRIKKVGDDTDILKLGQGPFPLPIGQHPDEVREQFEVNLMPSQQDHPDYIGVELRPRPGTRLESKLHQIIAWIDPSNQMPVIIETIDANQIKATTSTLTSVKINEGVDDSTFELQEIDESNWTTEQIDE